MIRQVRTDDATAIASIYNGYVTGSNITFEEEPVTVEEMTSRIAGISAGFPYLIWVEDGAVKGYCYAHAWKAANKGKAILNQCKTVITGNCLCL